ncbi:MAG: response regulator [Kiritimatiellae bacterium]|nr:response regulator [Kiritimatiellia bacterium]
MNRQILVVDDDPQILDVMKKTLEQALDDVTVIGCRTVKEAQSVFKGSDSVQLLVSDIVMPVETGWELIRWLKTQGKFEKLPVIVMSGYITESDVTYHEPESLICGFVSKPINFDNLASMIKNQLKK